MLRTFTLKYFYSSFFAFNIVPIPIEPRSGLGSNKKTYVIIENSFIVQQIRAGRDQTLAYQAFLLFGVSPH